MVDMVDSTHVWVSAVCDRSTHVQPTGLVLSTIDSTHIWVSAVYGRSTHACVSLW